MSYELLVLDLDGTLTNSKKEITEPTKRALLEIQSDGKKVVLASGRPEQGVLPLAKELQLEKYGSYILSYNGGRIRQCKTQEIIYNKLLPNRVVKPIYEIVKKYPRVDLATYRDDTILSGLTSTKYTELESFINHMPIVHQPDFGNAIDFPMDKSAGHRRTGRCGSSLKGTAGYFPRLSEYLQFRPLVHRDHATEHRQGKLPEKTALKPEPDSERNDLLRRWLQRPVHDRVRRSWRCHGKCTECSEGDRRLHHQVQR